MMRWLSFIVYILGIFGFGTAHASCEAALGDSTEQVFFSAASNTLLYCGSSNPGWSTISTGGGGVGDRISTTGVASGANLGMVVAQNGTISFTTGGVAGTAFLDSVGRYVGPGVSITTLHGVSSTNGLFSGRLVSGLVSVTNISMTTSQYISPTSNVACGSSIAGAVRFNGTNSSLEACDGTSWSTIGSSSIYGYETQVNSLSAGAGNGWYYATCSAGKKVLGGTCSTGGGSGQGTVPSGSNAYGCYKGDGGVTTLTIYAICAQASSAATALSGSGSSGQVTYWTGSATQSGSNNLFWDSTNNRLSVGGNTAPTSALQVSGTFTVSLSTQTTNPTFFANSSGNVGIGTASPAQRLHVQSASNSYTSLFTDGTVTTGIFNGTNGSSVTGGFVGTSSNHPLHLFTNNGSAQLTLTTAGNVGIGTTSPIRKVQIANQTPLLLTNTDFSNGTAGSMFVAEFGAPSGNTYTMLGALSAGGTAWNNSILQPGGNVGIGTFAPTNPLQMASGAFVSSGGTWTNASDARLKTDIKPAPYGLAEVLKLRPVAYTFKSDGSHQVGLIAQEVRKVMPELVIGKEGDISRSETLGLSYGQLSAVLVNAIKELKADNDRLQRENSTILEGCQRIQADNENIRSDLRAIKQRLP